ncbi:hypothetical protein OPV22_033597 [Ensete ventricosum]|uniref:DUF547 domain-containing protein n=1 Tax=Ensete ventricosum TaxID=4639 RepID=A0AAV8P3H4_ENSVE|nr:hypothetical protein OPV22_033597 [Ensete ventricosum]
MGSGSPKFPVEEMDTTREVSTRHKRSKSDSDKRIKADKLDTSVISFHHVRMDMEEVGQAEVKKRPSPNNVIKSSLEKEIQQLEKCLEVQFVVHRALEQTLQHKSSAIDTSADTFIPKSTKELIREIAMLELEVVHLEQYLLSFYRRAFEQQMSSASHTAVEAATQAVSFQKFRSAVRLNHILLPQKMANCREKHGCLLHRSHSSLMPPSSKNSTRSLEACHALSLLEHGQQFNSGVTSLADHLGTTVADHVPETPNSLSEDMIRSMCAIYRKLTDHHHVGHCGVASSPTSSFSSRNTFSPYYTGELRSPCCKREAMVDTWIENSCCTKRFKEFSGPYSAMVEVSSICKSSQTSTDVKEMLHNYKMLVHRLETVDPRMMSNEEKIAFWINIHNAMLMHAHLEYGIPGSNIKKVSFLVKNMYNIGGRMVNAYIIQSSILGCRMHPPGQWLRLIISSKVKAKNGEEWKGYAIENSQPLLRFALCAGSHSDPAVRVYSPKRLSQLLETAKMEYIHATVTIRRGQKILLPKIVDSFAKDSKFSDRELVDMIECCVPESLRLMADGCHSSSRKMIEWVPHNFTFRYLLSR